MRNMSKKLFSVLVGVGLLLGASSFAHATCTTYGKITQVRAYTTGTYVWVMPESSTSTAKNFFFWVPNNDAHRGVNMAIGAAHSTHKTVQIKGSASSCPTASTGGYAGSISTPFYSYENR